MQYVAGLGSSDESARFELNGPVKRQGRVSTAMNRHQSGKFSDWGLFSFLHDPCGQD